MPSKSLNRSLHAAKATKQDEFYTQLSDIEKELVHYKKHFKNKTVLCNCDDPRVSNFFKYFLNNFEALNLKRLITTCFQNDKPDLFSQHKSPHGIYFEYSGEQKGHRLPDPTKITPRELKADGDFRSQECVNLLRQADVVVTNPPFSLFREYLEQLVAEGKKFIIIGNKNVITYKEPFRLIKENMMWVGVTPMGTDMTFGVSRQLGEELVKSKKHGSAYRMQNGMVMARAQACWFTNLEHRKRHEELILFKIYNPKEYPTYDNYDAIEVSRTADIPVDYDGAMGVPITFLDKYNPDQFQIIGQTDRDNSSGLRTKKYTFDEVSNPNDLNRAAVIRDGRTYKAVYMRIVIKRKK